MASLLNSFVDNKYVTAAHYITRNLFQFSDLAVSTRSKVVTEFLGRYNWIRAPIRETADLKALFSHRNPAYNSATLRVMTYMLSYVFHTFKRVIREPEKLLWHEDLVSPEIFITMDLVPFLVETLPILLPNVSSEITEHYIDVCENAGYPGDTCTLPKTTIGMVLDDQLPPPKAIVASNTPCDGGMASYAVMEEKYKVPVFRLDLPYTFREKRAQDYYLREIKRMIAWLEDIYSVRMDYDRLREVCEERNRAQAYALDLWDLQRCSPAPIGGETLIFGHFCYVLGMGGKAATKILRDLLKIAQRSIQRDGGGIPNERHRYILWNPLPLVYPEFFSWMEKEYGAIAVMDMLTYREHPYIDTSTPESMLKDLAYIMAHGPMAQHTRGPYENFFGDLFHIYETFSADMIVMAGHVGCKNTKALFGMFKEQCRKRSIPLLIFDYDLSDTRPMSPNGIRRQVADFMENIMGERRAA